MRFKTVSNRFLKAQAVFTACVTAAVLCASSVTVLAQEVIPAAQTPPDTVVIDVMHTNDIHSRAAYKKDKIIGYEKLATYVNETKPDLLLDAGDVFHGQAFATLEQGASIAELMNLIKYDAMTPGNHDWNYGKDRLKELGKMANTPILAGNVEENGQDFFAGDATLIKDIDGVKVGVLGVFDPDVAVNTAPKNMVGISVLNDAQTATELAKQLRTKGCDVVIALTHQLDCPEFIAEISGIDAVIAGHEHVVLNETYKDADNKDVQLVESGFYFSNIGTLSITYDTKADAITAMEEKTVTAADAATVESDKTVSDKLAQINARQAEKLNEVVGSTDNALDGRWESVRAGETTMGRVITSAYLNETGADIAFENAGGIRLGREIPAGNITYRDLIDTAPFGNYITTQQINGSAVKSMLEKSVAVGIENKKSYDEWMKTGSDKVKWPDNSGTYLQIGGLTVSYDTTKPAGERVISVECAGKPLDYDKMYTVATNNFMAMGTEYSELADAKIINQYAACDEALETLAKLGKATINEAALKVRMNNVTPENPSSSANPSSAESQTLSSQLSSAQTTSQLSQPDKTAETTSAKPTNTNPLTSDNTPIIYLLAIGIAALTSSTILIAKKH